MSEPDLNAAYALETPDDNRKLYADWAQSYDTSFAVEMDYLLPRSVADILRELFAGTGCVLDVGAGTGLVAECLNGSGWVIDGLDISADMLAVAAQKKVYSAVLEADLTGALDIADGVYDAVVSAGTFTHGHVGPDALDELIRVARKGAVFVLAVNAEHFEARGFGAKFAALEPVIERFETRLIDIYGSGADDAHAADQSQIAVFYKR